MLAVVPRIALRRPRRVIELLEIGLPSEFSAGVLAGRHKYPRGAARTRSTFKGLLLSCAGWRGKGRLGIYA